MQIKKCILLFFLIICLSYDLLAQTNNHTSTRISSIEESEISESEKQTLIEDLYYLSLNPININTADRKTLLLIGLSEFQILSLHRYIKETHPLLSIYEIPIINGFSEQTLEEILPYIYVAPVNWKPSLRLDSISSKAIHDIRLQYKQVLEKAWGYRRDDSLGFIGDNFSNNIRYNLNYYDRLSLSLIADKDAGEPFFSSNQKYGYDYISFQATIKDISFIEQITIGDYRLGFGEGLAINQNLNFGHFSPDAKSKKNYSGIKPNRSVIEYNYMRGLATKLKLKDFSVFLFGSYNKIDYSGSILETGLHRTLNELSKKDSNREMVYGTHVGWKRKGYEIGTTIFHYEYKDSIKNSNQNYMKHYFEGKENNIYSVNFSLPLIRRFRLFSELAMSSNKGYAGLIGLDFSIAYKTNLSINFRNYQNQFQNYYSSAIGAQSRNANEKGIYAAYSMLINRYFNFFIAGDYFYFPDESYRANQAVRGYKIKGEINYSPNSTNLLSLLYKNNNRPYNETHPNKEIYPEDNILQQIQLRYSLTHKDWLMLKSRIGYSQTQSYPSEKNQGGFISQDLILKPQSLPLSLNLRFAYFNTDDYDNAFYVYEYGLPLNYSSSQLYDKGIRSYIILRYDFNPNIFLTARYSLTNYFNKTTIHSSNDRIDSNKKQEIGFQFYWLINKKRRKEFIFEY
ncbi:MAG: hypothetical protein PHN41_04950 [Bacteroidales bacterium]|nr:hypothetical protein [Bacteroidales bacterium]